MTTVLQSLEHASFRGEVFLIDTATTTGGRKTVTHEFVNSDNRNTEDLGKLLKKFSVVGIITDTDGDAYLAKRNRLIAALETGGAGTLIHPFYGLAEVVALPYSINEDVTRLGEAVFTMDFEISTEEVLPQPELIHASNIVRGAEAMAVRVALDVSGPVDGSGSFVQSSNSFITGSLGAFNVSNNFVNSYESSRATVTLVAESFESVIGVFDVAEEVVSEFNALLTNYTDSIIELINLPIQLAADTKALFDQLELVVSTNLASLEESLTLGIPQALEIWQDFFGFNEDSDSIGTSIDVGNEISVETAEIIKNEQLLTRQIRGTSLALAYSTVALTTFTNIDALETSEDILEEQFQKLYADTTTPPETLEVIQDLRDAAETFFQEKKLTINDVTTVTIKRMPAQVLNYFLYGNLDSAEDLVNLNDNVDVCCYEGDVLVFVE